MYFRQFSRELTLLLSTFFLQLWAMNGALARIMMRTDQLHNLPFPKSLLTFLIMEQSSHNRTLQHYHPCIMLLASGVGHSHQWKTRLLAHGVLWASLIVQGLQTLGWMIAQWLQMTKWKLKSKETMLTRRLLLKILPRQWNCSAGEGSEYFRRWLYPAAWRPEILRTAPFLPCQMCEHFVSMHDSVLVLSLLKKFRSRNPLSGIFVMGDLKKSCCPCLTLLGFFAQSFKTDINCKNLGIGDSFCSLCKI